MNAETYEVEDYLLVGQRVWQLGFSPDESLIFSHQRRLQRHFGHRRGGARGHQDGPGRAAALGRRRDAAVIAAEPIRDQAKNERERTHGSSTTISAWLALAARRSRSCCRRGAGAVRPDHQGERARADHALFRSAARRRALRARSRQVLPHRHQQPTARPSSRSAGRSSSATSGSTRSSSTTSRCGRSASIPSSSTTRARRRSRFITIRPGTFTLRIPGTTGESAGGHVQREVDVPEWIDRNEG